MKRTEHGILTPALIVAGLGILAWGCGDDGAGGQSDAANSDSDASDVGSSEDVSNDGAGPDGTTADGTTADGAELDSESKSEAVVATFNAGLALNFVPYAAERVALVGEALAGLEADVVCLQEVWLDGDRDALVTAAAARFPHAFFHRSQQGTNEEPPACTAAEADPLFACVQDNNCAEAADLVGCVLAECGPEFGALSTECLGCISANVSEPLDDIYTTCTSGNTEFAYDGHNGLLLLSTTPFSASEWIEMDSSLVRRAALHVRLATGLDVVCTHLAADLSAIQAYTGDFGSFEAEQAHQIEQLRGWVDEVAEDAYVLAGDFNTGPESIGISPELPANWEMLSEGLAAPFVTGGAAVCTFCSDNPLVSEPDGKSVLIDHLLLSADVEAASVERIFDGVVTIPADPPVEDGRLSDHYGIRAHLTWPL